MVEFVVIIIIRLILGLAKCIKYTSEIKSHVCQEEMLTQNDSFVKIFFSIFVSKIKKNKQEKVC